MPSPVILDAPVFSVRTHARQKLLRHRAGIIWLTGLSGAGKSTLATALDQRLLSRGILSAVLDGDVLRRGLCAGLEFSDVDRRENIRRASEAALIVAEAGLVAIVALISPFRADRSVAAEKAKTGGVAFAEVYVNTPISVCESRDPKALYVRARAGEIPRFTGISSAYEAPLAPALELRTDDENLDECLAKLEALALDMASPLHGSR